MKKITLVLPIFLLQFLLINKSNAQREYWGVTSGGGNYCRYSDTTGFIPTTPQPPYEVIGGGVLFKTDKTGHNQQTMHKFDSSTGFRPRGSLTLASNGKLYGMANRVGLATNNSGVIFEFDPIINIYTLKKQLGGDLKGQLLSATNGKLYGTHVINEYGMTSLFSYDPLLDTIIEIHTFDFFAGYPAQGYTQMMQASNGKIYIPFSDGGGVGYGGVLYEYNPINNVVTQLYKYYDYAGSTTGGTLIEYSPNILYGTFTNGDNFNLAKGGIYKFDLTTNTLSIVARMDSIGGRFPACGLTRVGNKLYGATYAGGVYYDPNTDPYGGYGIIFEFEPTSRSLKKLYDFKIYPYLNYDIQHGYSYNDLNGWGTDLFSSNGLLYGLTQYGSMFSYNVADSQFTSLFGLFNTNGAYADHAKVIELCTKPYFINFITDTITAIPGSPFNFTIHSKNTEIFHWQKNNSFINDTDSILNFNPFTISDTGKYTCQLTNECGNTITKIIYLKSGVTPVTLLTFTANLQNNDKTLLQWKTSQELNNHYFNVQRSTDGINFTTIGSVNGNGTTSLTHSYQYIDKEIPAAIIYYRLQQVDYDGQFKYSNIEVVHNKQQPISAITNNQAHTITVNFSQFQKGNVIFNLFTSSGQLVKSIKQKNVQNIIINSTGLASGIYQLQIITTEKTSAEKIIINQ